MRFIIQISAWTSSPLAFQNFLVLPLFQESLEPLGTKWSTSFEGETLKFGLHLRDPVSPGPFWVFELQKKTKRGQMVVKNIPNAFRDPEKEHGCPSNLPAFRDPEKEHHWHRSHELSCHRDASNCLLHTSLSENRIPQQFAGSSSYFRLKWL